MQIWLSEASYMSCWWKNLKKDNSSKMIIASILLVYALQLGQAEPLRPELNVNGEQSSCCRGRGHGRLNDENKRPTGRAKAAGLNLALPPGVPKSPVAGQLNDESEWPHGGHSELNDENKRPTGRAKAARLNLALPPGVPKSPVAGQLNDKSEWPHDGHGGLNDENKRPTGRAKAAGLNLALPPGVPKSPVADQLNDKSEWPYGGHGGLNDENKRPTGRAKAARLNLALPPGVPKSPFAGQLNDESEWPLSNPNLFNGGAGRGRAVPPGGGGSRGLNLNDERPRTITGPRRRPHFNDEWHPDQSQSQLELDLNDE